MKAYYQENGQTIYCGDCREILPELGIYDLVLTDPPYAIEEHYDTYKDTDANLSQLVLEAFPLIKRSGVVTLLTPGNKNQHLYPEPDWTLCWHIPAGMNIGRWGFIGWQPILAYGKDPYLRESKGCMPDTYSCNAAAEINGHPTPKPEKIWKWLCKRGASRATDSVLDPFLGSGTTLVVAKQLGHKATGIEINERYCEIAANRLRQSVMEF